MPSIEEIRNQIIVRVNNASGVIVSPLDNGMLYIFTCKHVVEDKINDTIFVRYDTDQNDSNITFELIEIITDETHQSDAAIICVKRNSKDIPHLFPSSELAGCYHIGFPACRIEAANKFRNDRVSPISRFDDSVENLYIEYEYQTPPQQNELKGMSGGGIFNAKGCLVGIHTQSSMDDSQELLGKAVMIPVNHYLNLIRTNGLSPVYRYDLSQFGEMVSWVFDFREQTFIYKKSSQFSADIHQYKKIIATWSPAKIIKTLIDNNKIRQCTVLESLDSDYWYAFTLFLVGIISFLDLDENNGEKAILSLYDRFHYCYSDKNYDVYKVRDQLSEHHLIGKVKGAYLIVGGLNKTAFHGCYTLPTSKVPNISEAHQIIDELDITIGKQPLLDQITIINNNIFEKAVEKCADNEDIEIVTIEDYRELLKKVINIEQNG